MPCQTISGSRCVLWSEMKCRTAIILLPPRTAVMQKTATAVCLTGFVIPMVIIFMKPLIYSISQTKMGLNFPYIIRQPANLHVPHISHLSGRIKYALCLPATNGLTAHYKVFQKIPLLNLSRIIMASHRKRHVHSAII